MKRVTRNIYWIGLLALLMATTANASGQKDQEKVTVRVDGLSCPFCAYGLEKKLQSLNAVQSLNIKINEGIVEIFLKDGFRISEKDIRTAVNEAGFTPRDITIPEALAKIEENVSEIILHIEGIQCSQCASQIHNALSAVDCVREVHVDQKTAQAVVLCTGDKNDQKKLVNLVVKLGFNVLSYYVKSESLHN